MNLQNGPLIFTLLALALATSSNGDLTVGFYDKTCPSVESLVQQTVAAAFAKNFGVATGLIRLYAHDCFVRGCDGSILLDSTESNEAEKDSPANSPRMHGYEVIDEVKAAVEAACPEVVSCADIIAFAARDSVKLTGNITYEIPSGRRDGPTSISSEALANLPAPQFSAAQLVSGFGASGINAEEMVTLSGVHSIGYAHCPSFAYRLYDFSSSSPVDPSFSSEYAAVLQSLCPNTTAEVAVPLDPVTPHVLDNQYYKNLYSIGGVLGTDQQLVIDPYLETVVKKYADSPNEYWATNFARAMVKMGYIKVLTGAAGEIRKNCRVVNSASASQLYAAV